jgi:hypothetical protein
VQSPERNRARTSSLTATGAVGRLPTTGPRISGVESAPPQRWGPIEQDADLAVYSRAPPVAVGEAGSAVRGVLGPRPRRSRSCAHTTLLTLPS